MPQYGAAVMPLTYGGGRYLPLAKDSQNASYFSAFNGSVTGLGAIFSSWPNGLLINEYIFGTNATNGTAAKFGSSCNNFEDEFFSADSSYGPAKTFINATGSAADGKYISSTLVPVNSSVLAEDIVICVMNNDHVASLGIQVINASPALTPEPNQTALINYVSQDLTTQNN